MVYKDGTLENNFPVKWNFWRNRTPIQLKQYAWIILLVYRLIAIGVALAQIYLFQINTVSLLSPVALAAGISLYTILRTVLFFSRYNEGIFNLILLAIDIIVCFVLVAFTAGLSSPYLLYTLAPVLTAAFYMDRRIAASTALLSAVLVLSDHVFNPFFKTVLNDSGLSYFFIYVTSVSLAAALPYLINTNLRQKLQSQDILQERQRLSREIHDGSVQTLAALNWQIQIVEHKLSLMGVEIPETKRLEELAERAHQDALTSLNFLREYQQKGSFVERLEKALALPGSTVNTNICIESKNISLSPYVEHEVLRICQEAIINIKKHAEAKNAQVSIKSEGGYIKVKVSDDGRGFNLNSYRGEKGNFSGHGLSVMQERAESMGGKLQIVSQPGQGTEIQLEVPYSRKGKLWNH